MCGIVGYVGPRTASELLLTGLRRLEYRGYDSAGLATIERGQLNLLKTEGRVQELANLLRTEAVPGTIGIAHTRWATHGRPSTANAHPHLDQSGRIALVHNGVIENHVAIRSLLKSQGVEFRSETDTESLVQLIGSLYRETGDLLESVRQALCSVKGTFGLALRCADAPQTLIAARRGSSLIVGIGSDQFFVASDASALAGHTSQVTYLEDNEIVTLGAGGLSATNIDAQAIEKNVETLELKLEQIDLKGYTHHMLKEIYEQPEAIRNALSGRVHTETNDLKLGGLEPVERQLPHYRRVLLFGCGTAWHAALIGEHLFQDLAQLPTKVEYSSELRYRNPIIEEGTLAIAVSQSGETADTLAALQEVQIRGATALGVVNVVSSSIARKTDAGVYLHVGPEIGVASTKAFTAQVTVLAMLATYLGRRRQLFVDRMSAVLHALQEIPNLIEEALQLEDQVEQLARRLADHDNWLYLGRGVNFPAALEGALKLKEVSYVHAEGLPAAEMKHGPIAMIDDGMPVVVLAPRDHTYEKVLVSIEEVRSRGGRVIAVANAGDPQLENLADEVIYVPATLPILSPLLTSIPLQLLAYHAAVVRGRDVDKPRNLAKSVTVE